MVWIIYNTNFLIGIFVQYFINEVQTAIKQFSVFIVIEVIDRSSVNQLFIVDSVDVILIVSHNMEDVEDIIDVKFQIDSGEIVEGIK